MSEATDRWLASKGYIEPKPERTPPKTLKGMKATGLMPVNDKWSGKLRPDVWWMAFHPVNIWWRVKGWFR